MTISDLYDEYESKLQRYAVNLARDADGADDLVQETFIRAMGHLSLLERLNPYQRRAWLYRTLKNRFIDGERARQRQQVTYERLARDVEVSHNPMASIMIPSAIDLAPERYRELLYKRYMMAQTSEEIGKELGVPAATVRSRLYLARKWIRTHYPELG
jgi:RNA polymerase sigma-70 factor (ECF subfamily)